MGAVIRDVAGSGDRWGPARAQQRSGDRGVVIDEVEVESRCRKVEEAQHLVVVLVEELEGRDGVLERNVWRRREVDQDLFERRWPPKAVGQSPVGGTAPAGVTAPAKGRQARMDTSSNRRALILDLLCWAARCETQPSHGPQKPGHLHLAGYSHTSATCNRKQRRQVWTVRRSKAPRPSPQS